MWLREVDKDRGTTRLVNLTWAAGVSIAEYKDGHYLEVQWPYINDAENNIVTAIVGPFATRKEAEVALGSVCRGITEGHAVWTIVIEDGMLLGEWGSNKELP